MRLLCLITLLLASSAATAQYRCTVNGKTVFTDRPCPGEGQSTERSQQGTPSKTVGDVGNSAYSSASGTWRGQVQYQATGKGGVIQEAMAVVPLTIDVDPQGKVVGSSPENGCKLRGIASPGIVPTSVSLDITFSDCRYSAFNRRLFGTLTVNQAQKYAQFSLNGTNANPFGGMFFFDIKGTMRR